MANLDQLVPDLDALLAAIRPGALLLGSVHHGEGHWLAVGRCGVEIRESDPACDGRVLLLFAMLHDARRELEQRDPGHGPRAAALAASLHASELFVLDDAALALLDEACRLHDTGAVSDEPTIGACYNSDRLNLRRLGIEPDPALLSRRCSRAPGFIDRCSAFDGRRFTWAELAERLLD